ncbi:MAG TPA: hypothetical protein VL096_10725, partial [Pirellulaceae bacterium]|nr:hypothetical protein [Pirellulaceae bacterium]
QHTFGIVWLTQQVRQGNSSWLRLQGELPARKQDAYCAKVTLAGQIEDTAVPRVPPAPAKNAPQAVDTSLLADQAP